MSKNPIEYFIFDFSIGGYEKSDKHSLRCELSHESLPIFISVEEDFYYEDGKVPKDLHKTVLIKAYSKLYETIINGKSKPMQKGWHVRWYYGEWDSEKNLWFVMDKDGNRLYNMDHMQGIVADELNTD